MHSYRHQYLQRIQIAPSRWKLSRELQCFACNSLHNSPIRTVSQSGGDYLWEKKEEIRGKKMVVVLGKGERGKHWVNKTEMMMMSEGRGKLKEGTAPPLLSCQFRCLFTHKHTHLHIYTLPHCPIAQFSSLVLSYSLHHYCTVCSRRYIILHLFFFRVKKL